MTTAVFDTGVLNHGAPRKGTERGSFSGGNHEIHFSQELTEGTEMFWLWEKENSVASVASCKTPGPGRSSQELTEATEVFGASGRRKELRSLRYLL